MTVNKFCITLLILVGATPVLAESPKDFVSSYSAAAGAGFTPTAARGKQFFDKNWNVSQKMPSCKACHGSDLNVPGEHVITGKSIGPLSPAANAERFTDPKKVEKWFKRNCTEVVGRECSAAEKADYIQFALLGGKP